jgi:hypothetical protein
VPAEPHPEPPEAEWNFSQCPKSEAGILWLFENLRTFVLRFPTERVAKETRQAIETTRRRLRRSSEKATCKAIRKYLKDAPLATLIHVGFEQWPEDPYLSIEQSERQRRLALLLPDFFPTPDRYLGKNISPYTIPAGFELKLRESIAKDPEKPRFIECDAVAQSNFEFELRDGLKQFEALSSDNPRYMGAVLIDPRDGRTRFLRQCEALWNSVIPKGGNFPKRKRGLGSLFAQAPSDLRKLSAWRLHRVYGMSVDEAIAFLHEKVEEGKLAKVYYKDSKNFLRAVRGFESVIKEYLR